MTSKNSRTGNGGRFLWLPIVAVVVAWLSTYSPDLAADEFLSEFEGPETSCRVLLRPQQSQVAIHQRRRGIGREGGAEFIRFRSTQENSPVRIEHFVPAATVLDELEVSLWLKSNHDGFALEVRIVLPEILDPETNKPLTIQIAGDRYENIDQWQLLKCRTTDRAKNDQVRLLRALKQIPINPKVMFVERVVLKGQLPPGDTDLYLDNLKLTPLVRFESHDSASSSGPIQQVNQSVEAANVIDPNCHVPVQFRLHRLSVEGKPFFPRIVTYQQERPEVLSSAGINVAWVSDYENTNVTNSLRRQGVWVTAAPPFAKGTDGEPLDSDDASLLPFQANTSPVLFWMLGARMTPDARPRLTSWANQIRDADRRFDKRPIAADVIENERLCSRHVDLLGLSRHVVHSNCSMSDYRDWLIERRDQAWPDTFCWTWIQTEPAPSLVDLSRAIESPPMLEPEQIRLQVYAALAAGCRGLGFWTTTPLDHDSLAAKERLLVLKQLNLELDLFEPWITSGNVPQLVSFKVEVSRNDQSTVASKNSKNDSKTKSRSAATAVSTTAKKRKYEQELHAAMIRSEQGALLLPMWLEDGAQFVPGPMSAENVTIIVPGGGETAAAWEITTTGLLRHLDREPAAGGVQIKLARFDQTAAILITNKQSTVDDLNQKILAIQEQSARASVDLAKLKLERIRLVDQTLQSLGVGRKDAWQWLGDAKLQLDKADSALRAQQPSEARQYAGKALQYGRYLQRAYWDQVSRRLSSPTSNPWAVSFQSLPEYWRMSRRVDSLGSSDAQVNLLPSGEFEDPGTLIGEHWQHEQSMLDTVESSAKLYGAAKQGDFCLRLSARPTDGETVPKSFSKPPVLMVSPAISVRAGQVVRITGWAKVPATILGSVDGAMIYDSLLGKTGAIRLKTTQDWQRFELLRPVPESQEMTVTFALNGVGDVLFDDLRVACFELGSDAPLPPSNKSSIAPTKYSPLDLRRLNPLQKRP